MKRNRSMPPATVIPVLTYPDVRAAVDWLASAFGFSERTRIGESHRAQMGIGADGAMIVADDGGQHRHPHVGMLTHLMKVRVENVDTLFEHARAHGATVIEAPTDHPYGERDCLLEDLAGHRWQFSQTVRDVAPEEYGCITVRPWPG